MRTRRRHILRGFVVGSLIGLAISVSLLVLACVGLESHPLFRVAFSPSGIVALAMQGDNGTGHEPLVIRVLPVAATVVVHVLVGAGLGALVAMITHFTRGHPRFLMKPHNQRVPSSAAMPGWGLQTIGLPTPQGAALNAPNPPVLTLGENYHQ